jgi:hypothetical protein
MVGAMAEQGAPPGWYDNPNGGGNLRYWSGKKWLSDVRNKTAAEASGQPTAMVALPMAPSSPLEAPHSTVAPGDRNPGVLWEAVGKPLTGIGAGKYRLTSHYLFFEKGALRTDLQQVPVAALLDVDVRQSMSQKARGVGTVIVHIQRATRIELVTLEDIPNFREGQRAINETAHAARAKILAMQNTSTVNYQGTHPASAATPQALPTPQPEVVAAVDYVAQLEKLGQLRDVGILTDEEFQAKKAEILRRI